MTASGLPVQKREQDILYTAHSVFRYFVLVLGGVSLLHINCNAASIVQILLIYTVLQLRSHSLKQNIYYSLLFILYRCGEKMTNVKIV